MLISSDYRNNGIKFGCTQTQLCEPVKNVASKIVRLPSNYVKLDEKKVGIAVRDLVEKLINENDCFSHKKIAEYLEKLLNIDLPVLSNLIMLASIGKPSVRKAALDELLNNRTFSFNLKNNCENKVIKKIAKCPDCDETLLKRGFNPNKNGKTQRYSCNKCEKFFDETKVKITEEVVPEIRCRHCDSSNVKKNGKFDGVQIFECKDCGENSLKTYKYARKSSIDKICPDCGSSEKVIIKYNNSKQNFFCKDCSTIFSENEEPKEIAKNINHDEKSGRIWNRFSEYFIIKKTRC